MIDKEDHILLPMCLDTLTEDEWHEVAKQSLEFGFCLYDPPDTWRPAAAPVESQEGSLASGRIQLPSGSVTPAELTAILNTIPFDLTFVDRDDTVRYFTQGRERIFSRSRAILGRKVQFCHPPSSVKVVEQILADFRSARHDRAAFWISMRERFIHIEYFALRDEKGQYLGTLEVSKIPIGPFQKIVLAPAKNFLNAATVLAPMSKLSTRSSGRRTGMSRRLALAW